MNCTPEGFLMPGTAPCGLSTRSTNVRPIFQKHRLMFCHFTLCWKNRGFAPRTGACQPRYHDGANGAAAQHCEWEWWGPILIFGGPMHNSEITRSTLRLNRVWWLNATWRAWDGGKNRPHNERNFPQSSAISRKRAHIWKVVVLKSSYRIMGPPNSKKCFFWPQLWLTSPETVWVWILNAFSCLCCIFFVSGKFRLQVFPRKNREGWLSGPIPLALC